MEQVTLLPRGTIYLKCCFTPKASITLRKDPTPAGFHRPLRWESRGTATGAPAASPRKVGRGGLKHSDERPLEHSAQPGGHGRGMESGSVTAPGTNTAGLAAPFAVGPRRGGRSGASPAPAPGPSLPLPRALPSAPAPAENGGVSAGPGALPEGTEPSATPTLRAGSAEGPGVRVRLCPTDVSHRLSKYAGCHAGLGLVLNAKKNFNFIRRVFTFLLVCFC